MRRTITALISTAVLTLMSTGLVSAGTGFCNPGRASNPGEVIVSLWKVNPQPVNVFDAVRATFADYDPYVESGRTKAYVRLQNSNGNGEAEFGYYINFAGARKIFLRLTENDGDVVVDREYAPDISQLDGGILNGTGGDTHKFTINRIGGVNFSFQFNIDGNTVAEYSTGLFNGWDGKHAEVRYSIGNGGSQWWGKTAQAMYADKVEYEFDDDPAQNNWNGITNLTNKAGSNLFEFLNGDKQFRIWDKDC